jgi:Ras-related GTP-binding protein A/B
VQDCAGQGSYMDTYLDNARRVTFQGVAILIYVFDTTSTEWDSDVSYFERVLEGLREYSVEEEEEDEEGAQEDYSASESGGESGEEDGEPSELVESRRKEKTKKKRERPGVYILINKMDLEDPSQRERIEREKARPLVEMVREIVGGKCKAFGTSIWDESLYRVSCSLLLLSVDAC